MMAEITISHLLRLANEHGCSVSREQALAFLNQQGRAFEMWKQMMQAGEEFIARSLLRQCISPESLLSHAIANLRRAVMHALESLAQMWA